MQLDLLAYWRRMKTNRILIAKVRQDLACEEWTSLVEIYQPLISQWASRFGGSADEIADIAQDVLYVVVRDLSKFEHNGRTGAFRNWLKTITINRLRQLWKQQARRRIVNSEFNEEALQSLTDPNSELSIRWNREHDQHVFDQVISRVSREFDEKTMTAFRKFVIEGQDSQAVAKELGVSAAQVYKYKFRVVQRMKSLVVSIAEPAGLDSVFNGVGDEIGRASGAMIASKKTA